MSEPYLVIEHSPEIKRKIQSRLERTYGDNPHAGPFLAKMNYGDDVVFARPDPRYIGRSTIVAYHDPGHIFVAANCAPEDALHELRHEFQCRAVGWGQWQRLENGSDSRLRFLAGIIVESDAHMFEAIAADHSLKPKNRFEDYLVAYRPTAEEKLLRDFGVAARNLHYQPPCPDEIPFLHMVAQRICVLPDGANYLFAGLDPRAQKKVITDFRYQTLIRPVQEYYQEQAAQSDGRRAPIYTGANRVPQKRKFAP